MKQRIRRIIRERSGDPRIGTRWALLVAGLAVLLAVGAAFAQERPRRERPDQEQFAERREQRERAEALRRVAIEQIREQLAHAIREKEIGLREGGEELGPEDRQILEFQLQLLRQQMEHLERQLHARARRERPAPESEEPRAEARRRQSVDEHLHRMEARREELRQAAEAVEREMRGLRDDQDEEARALQQHLREIEEAVGQIEKEMEEVERMRGQGDRRAGTAERLRELHAEASEVRRELAGIEDKDSHHAQELRAHLDRMHAEMAEMERDLQQFDRQRPAEPRSRGEMPDERRRDLMRRRDQLTAHILEATAMLERRGRRGRTGDDAEHELRERLEQARQELREVDMQLTGEREGRRLAEESRRIVTRRRLDEPPGERPVPEDRRLRMELDELRGQVHKLHRQMEDMRALLEEVVERTRAPEAEEGL